MKYWLFKSEPSEFSIDDLAKAPKQTTAWEGVRNYQARNFMRDDMKVGDLGLFYHSSCPEPGIAGVVEIISPAHADTSAFDPQSDYFDAKSREEKPIWYCVDVQLKQKFNGFISLRELKMNPKLETLLILRKGNRLSITPITRREWETILDLGVK